MPARLKMCLGLLQHVPLLCERPSLLCGLRHSSRRRDEQVEHLLYLRFGRLLCKLEDAVIALLKYKL